MLRITQVLDHEGQPTTNKELLRAKGALLCTVNPSDKVEPCGLAREQKTELDWAEVEEYGSTRG